MGPRDGPLQLSLPSLRPAYRPLLPNRPKVTIFQSLHLHRKLAAVPRRSRWQIRSNYMFVSLIFSVSLEPISEQRPSTKTTILDSGIGQLERLGWA